MTDWLLRIVIAALIVYRLAQLVALDDGPKDIFLRLRIWAGVYNLSESGRPETSLGRLFECPYCLGIWFAAAVALLFDFSATFFLTWLAVAGLQSFLQSVGSR